MAIDFFAYMTAAQKASYLARDELLDLSAPIQSIINDAAAAKEALKVPAGLASVNNIVLPSNLTLQADSAVDAIFKRRANSPGNAFVSATNASDIRIVGIGFDGNKSAQTNAAHNLSFYQCEKIEIDRCASRNAKAVGGYGGGISFAEGRNSVNSRTSRVADCLIETCDGPGIYVNKEYFVRISGNTIKSNDDGVLVINYVFPPLKDAQNYLIVDRNYCIGNTKCGIRCVGFYTGGSALAPIPGVGVPPQKGVLIEGNTCRSNGQYGIAFQGHGSCITGNFCERNGTTRADGGILVNASSSAIVGNVVSDNAAYGIDGGGSVACSFDSNTFVDNGLTSGLTSTGLNIGGTVNCVANANVFDRVTGQDSSAIYASGIEYGGSFFDQHGVRLTLSGNSISLSSPSAVGIHVSNGMDNVSIRGNTVYGASPGKAFLLRGGYDYFAVSENGNVDWSNGGVVPSIASAATLVVPDVGDDFIVTGTTGISNIFTEAESAYHGKVRYVQITNGGSGYSVGSPPAVTFTGGGGTGAAGVALVSNSGQVVGVNVTNFGSGYTSPPTVSFGAGTTTATGIARLGCNNFHGRSLILRFVGGVVAVLQGGNLQLNGNYMSSAGGAGVLQLRGAFGNWYEVSRRS